MGFIASYQHLLKNNELEERSRIAVERLSNCTLCPWECKINRLEGKMGVCHTGKLARVSSYAPHHGEEAPLRGWRGSGTIFFGRCNLRCQFCQNFQISQQDAGEELDSEMLAEIMLELQSAGCHNINLVSPSHVIAPILQAVCIAARCGLNLPLVYNTGGYDSLETLSLLDGVIDIYMPDMKYASERAGYHYSKTHNYPSVNQAAVQEMFRQVGDLQVNNQGIAKRGLLVRHLVLPNETAGTKEVVNFIATKISKNCYVNIMHQYRPTYNARQFPRINRCITREEYDNALVMAKQAGLHRLDHS